MASVEASRGLHIAHLVLHHSNSKYHIRLPVIGVFCPYVLAFTHSEEQTG